KAVMVERRPDVIRRLCAKPKPPALGIDDELFFGWQQPEARAPVFQVPRGDQLMLDRGAIDIGSPGDSHCARVRLDRGWDQARLRRIRRDGAGQQWLELREDGRRLAQAFNRLAQARLAAKQYADIA